ncbi:MAG: ATP synthase F0 subunit C [Nitrospirae bacterium]|nr:MAG: ATP synthase F0 subunit C [Nitrospirota bacterium]
MKKIAITTFFIIALAFVGNALAEEGNSEKISTYGYFGLAALACVVGIGIGAAGAGIGQGLATKGAVEGIARNPGTSGKITVTLIIGLAMMESLVIYALVVALIILYAKPFGF